ncbi:DUF3352 domain-containing protein [Sphaerisporangium corydalis]|uniref:DUF3352 domain-containing protein n=1 Tax=Sphaerisporangium corydalis TaxID=1441875 RepID=A0ABV9EIP1_9ACTN|nr:DUF3352 domain-containing protein [Sphaerisporangium corydalis]
MSYRRPEDAPGPYAQQYPQQHGAPQHGGPQHAAPQQGGPQHAAPQHAAPQHGGPQHGGPQHAAPPQGGQPQWNQGGAQAHWDQSGGQTHWDQGGAQTHWDQGGAQTHWDQSGGQPAWQQGELGTPLSPPRKRGRGWLVAIIAAVVVAVVTGGGVFAVSLLSGGGTQPEDVLPAGSLAYVRVDLDPAANQKVALFNLARKFSATRSSFTGDDPRKALFDLISKDSKDLAKVDYARDIEPWLGSRLGVGVLAPKEGSSPDIVVALQVTDETGARAGLKKLNMGDAMSGLAFRDDYAILAATQAAADGYAKAAPLSGDPTFSGDLQALGEPGVLSFWGDAAKLAKISGTPAATEAGALALVKDARFAGALRFDSGYVELTGISRGSDMKTAADPEAIRLSQLPATTAAALSVSGLGETFAKQWPQLMKAAESAGATDITAQAAQSGIALPGDLVTLLGKNLTVALDGQGLDGATPNVGAVLTTDTAKAQAVITKIEGFLAASGTAAPQIAKAQADGRLILSSTQGYAGSLAKEGTLGESETFKIAIPDADSATAAVYVDLDKIEKYYLGSLQGEERANLKTLRAVGLSGKQSGDTTSFSLRVLFN